MFGQFLIAFREALEAALIVAIIVSYLARSGRRKLSRFVWFGAALALVVSLGLGAFVWFAYGSLVESVQLLFEAVAAFVAVAVLSSMIYWMAAKGRRIKEEMEERLDRIATGGAMVGLVMLGFVVVFREGFETTLFLTTFLVQDASGTLIGLLVGVLSASVVAYLVFAVGMRINLQKFFFVTSLMLVLLSGGLVGYGVHESLEYSEAVGFDVGWLAAPAYDLGIPAESLFHHKGLVGSVFAVLFGYTVKAEWARIILHLAYLTIALPIMFWIYGRRTSD